MYFKSIIALLAVTTAASCAPSGGDDSQCTTDQANRCCTGLTNGILNIDILPTLCLPLLGSCNNQVACCETNGIGLLNCLTIQL